MVKRKKSKQVQENIKDIDPAINDEQIFCDDLILTKEQLLEIKCSHLERENITKDLKVAFTEIQAIDRQKELMNLRISDIKNASTVKDRQHKELIEDIGRRVGNSLLDSQINFETGKVTFS